MKGMQVAGIFPEAGNKTVLSMATRLSADSQGSTMKRLRSAEIC